MNDALPASRTWHMKLSAGTRRWPFFSFSGLPGTRHENMYRFLEQLFTTVADRAVPCGRIFTPLCPSRPSRMSHGRARKSSQARDKACPEHVHLSAEAARRRLSRTEDSRKYKSPGLHARGIYAAEMFRSRSFGYMGLPLSFPLFRAVMSISSGSVVAFLKFLIALPSPPPISGSFFAPNSNMTTTNTTSKC